MRTQLDLFLNIPFPGARATSCVAPRKPRDKPTKLLPQTTLAVDSAVLRDVIDLVSDREEDDVDVIEVDRKVRASGHILTPLTLVEAVKDTTKCVREEVHALSADNTVAGNKLVEPNVLPPLTRRCFLSVPKIPLPQQQHVRESCIVWFKWIKGHSEAELAALANNFFGALQPQLGSIEQADRKRSVLFHYKPSPKKFSDYLSQVFHVSVDRWTLNLHWPSDRSDDELVLLAEKYFGYVEKSPGMDVQVDRTREVVFYDEQWSKKFCEFFRNKDRTKVKQQQVADLDQSDIAAAVVAV